MGIIDSDAPKRFEEYVKKNKIPDRSMAYINSPGGDLLAGIHLGQLLRRFGFSTDVGKKSSRSDKRYDVDPGSCFSACAYTYLGGRFRYMMNGSHYGVHRFAPSTPKQGNIDSGQIASAVIVEYTRSMDVDPALFSSSVIAGPSEMNELDRETLQKLNVVNNGRTRPSWTIESVEGNLYFKGERLNQESGVNKFMIFCENGKPALYVIFDALHREGELMSMRAHSLLLDGTPFPVRLESRTIQNGWFNGIYQLSSRDVEAIQRAKTVGIAMRFTYEAPVFLGFQEMPIEGGQQKLAGFLNTCRPR